MSNIPTEVLFSILGILIVVSAFFSGSETALMSLNRYKLKHLKKSGHKGAVLADWLLQRPDKLIGLILIFNNFVNILASAIATIIGLRLFGEAGIAIATGILTFVILVFAEVTPKTFAVIHPERLAFPATYILKPLLTIMYPLVLAINFISNNLLKLVGLTKPTNSNALDKDELRSIVNEMDDLIPQKHQSMLLNILDLEAVTVEDIMIPRNEIMAINIQDDWQTIKSQISHSLHTRLPVIDGDIDKILGIIHIKNTMSLFFSFQPEASDGQSSDISQKEKFKKLISETYFIPEGTSLYQQLIKFQSNKRRIGVVVDEYGDIQGMVTLEDVLEEIVGEFTTDPLNKLSDDIYPQKDGSYLIEANANIRELNRIMSWDLPTDSAKTMNGLILEYLESIPQSGTSILISNYPIEIIQIKNNSIKTVKINKQLDINHGKD
ncbi:MAG: HlyC/CorC family transporter [Pseudomonadota bacterium]